MPLNIKNDETCRLAAQLAQLTGTSMTRAVTEALREQLNRLQTPDALAKELLAIGQDCASRLKEPYLSIKHGDFLYDDKGLPR